MKLSIVASLIGSAAAFAPAHTGRVTTQIAESKVCELIFSVNEIPENLWKKNIHEQLHPSSSYSSIL